MDNKVFKAILKIIDYLTDSEMKHWEESGEPKKGHIFNYVQIVKQWAIGKVLDGKGIEPTKKLIGRVGVDSGQILITDPCYIDSEWDSKDRQEEKAKNHNFSYGGCCSQTLNKDGGGQLNYERGHAGVGVAVSSGYGDGLYEVWATYKDEGEFGKRVQKIEVIFF